MTLTEKFKRRILITLLTTAMVISLFTVLPAGAEVNLITTPEGYIRIPDRLLEQPKTKDLEILANEFLKQGYGVLVEV